MACESRISSGTMVVLGKGRGRKGRGAGGLAGVKGEGSLTPPPVFISRDVHHEAIRSGGIDAPIPCTLFQKRSTNMVVDGD